MSGLPLQVAQAEKTAEHLIAGTEPGEKAPVVDQHQQQTPEKTPQEQLEALQHKYKVLDGKYKKEIKAVGADELQRLTSENGQLKAHVIELQKATQANEDLVREVRAELDKKPNVEPVQEADIAPTDVSAILSDEDREHLEAEDLGGKTLEIIVKMMDALGAKGAGDVGNQVQQIAKQVQTVSEKVERSDSERAADRLKAEVPEFETVNVAPEFIAWLDQPINSFSQRLNRADLQDAISNGNYEAVNL
ncbi:unnamed protein product, partial [marine sediment metagenome]